MEPERRDIPGYVGYRVDTAGVVWSCWTPAKGPGTKGVGQMLSDVWHPLKPQPVRVRGRKTRRKQVHLTVGGKSKMVRVARLVLLAFVGKCPPGLIGCHNNGDAAADRLDNLRYGTHKDNSADRVKHGTATTGERNPCAKLTTAAVLEIRRRAATDPRATRAVLAAEFCVSQHTVKAIVAGQNWPSVGGLSSSRPRKMSSREKVTPDLVREIRDWKTNRQPHDTVSALSSRLGLTTNMVHGVLHGRTFQHVQ